MNKKYFCVFLAVLLLLSLLSPVSAFAANSLYCPNCGSVQLQGVVTQHDYCPDCGCYLYTTGGSFRGGGAGRLETGKKYYTAPSDGGAGNLYNTGDTSYYAIVNQQNNTLNYTSYSPTTNNYVSNSYTYNTYNYNETYNYYTYEINNQNYYVTNYYTYVVVSAPTATSTPEEPSYENTIIYYELPDGRNSYNLTVDDVWGEYFIYDAVNYNEVLEDDGVTLALYHLDESFEDSSANHQSNINSQQYSFVETPFESGIHLDNASSYICRYIYVKVPDGTKTIEFRYKMDTAMYKQYSSDDGTFSKGATTVSAICEPFNFSPSDNISNKAYYVVRSYPAGSWVSVALTLRDDGMYDLYVNGVRVSADSFEGYVANDYLVFTNKVYATTDYYLYYGSLVIDELRFSSEVLYTSDYTPSNQPFDTNSVLVLPDEGADNQIAVKSNIPVSDIRVGGVRPTYPTNGYTYVYLEDNVVKDVQQYQNDGWYSVDAAIYFDGEWKSLKDTDLSDYGNDEESPSTPTPSPDPVGPTPSPSDNPDPTLPPSTPETGDGDGDSDWNSLIDMILSLLNGLGDLLAAVISGLFSLFESLLTMASGFSEFLTASFGYLPADVLNVLGAGVVLMIVLAVIKFIRG